MKSNKNVGRRERRRHERESQCPARSQQGTCRRDRDVGASAASSPPRCRGCAALLAAEMVFTISYTQSAGAA
jgi:hypothetical protein